jgi:hypothetical protein
MPGKTTLVSNAAQLIKAAKTAQAGDTILLASGNYGDVSLASLRPAGIVTIKSANPDADAVFDSLKLTRVSNFVIADVDIHHVSKPGEPEWVAAATVNLSDHISFVGVDFTGSLNGNANDDGNGMMITSSSRVAVLDSTFQQFNNAIVVGRTDDIIVAGNTIREAREGVNISQVNGGLFENNLVTDINPDLSKGDHSDAFQVHAGGMAAVSNDLVFRSNVMLFGGSGVGGGAQGIYIHSEKGAKLGLSHTNIVVENNYYEGNFRHAIGASFVENIIVSGNTIRDGAGAGIPPGITTSNLRNAIIDNNITPIYDARRGASAASVNVAMSNNVDLWDSTTKAGVGDASIFAAAVNSGNIDFSSLEVRAGSSAALLNAGFHSTGGIGNLSGDTAMLLAAYLPQFNHHFATTFPV